MRVAGAFRVVRQKDRVVSECKPRPLSARGGSLDVKSLLGNIGSLPLLMVGASKKTGSAVERNKFRRRVRMAFLVALRKHAANFGRPFILFVRPARWSSSGCRIEYQDIEKQIESALNRMNSMGRP
jgi:ribonuclease P protein component